MAAAHCAARGRSRRCVARVRGRPVTAASQGRFRCCSCSFAGSAADTAAVLVQDLFCPHVSACHRGLNLRGLKRVTFGQMARQSRISLGTLSVFFSGGAFVLMTGAEAGWQVLQRLGRRAADTTPAALRRCSAGSGLSRRLPGRFHRHKVRTHTLALVKILV